MGAVSAVGIGYAYSGYDQCPGDSGSPVGKIIRGDFTVYGMHIGLADSGFCDQPTCSQGGRYSKFTVFTDVTDSWQCRRLHADLQAS